MKTITCKVRECGAEVILVELNGEQVELNPIKLQMVMEDPNGDLQWVKTYQPHGYTCVDISARLSRKQLTSFG